MSYDQWQQEAEVSGTGDLDSHVVERQGDERDNAGDDLRPEGLRPYADFVELTWTRVRRYAAARSGIDTLPNAADADDVVQIAFLKLFPRYESMANEAAALVYTLRAVNSTIRDALAYGMKRDGAWLARVIGGQQIGAPAEARVLSVLTRDAVRSAVAALPEPQREAVRRVDLEEAEPSEAAVAMGTTPAAVKGLLQRGRNRLRANPDLRHLIGAGVVPPFLRSLLPRRRAVLAACCSPSVVTAAALCLSVWQVWLPPARTYGTPLDSGHTLAATAPVPANPAVRDVPGSASSTATPDAVRTPEPTGGPGTPSPAPSPSKDAVPHEGACVAENCLGEDAGDEACIDREGKPVACANQGVVGMCPALGDLPGTTCERHSEPLIDTTPAPSPPPPPP